jgi:hypothetical protein
MMRSEKFTASTADYKAKLADFDFGGTTGEFERNFSKEGAVTKKREQYAHARSVDMIGSMTGAQMGAMLLAAERSYIGTTNEVPNKLTALYRASHANEAKILFNKNDPSFEEIMSNPVAVAQLQFSLSFLGDDKAYNYLTGAEKTVQHVNFGEKEEISSEDIQTSPEMQE